MTGKPTQPHRATAGLAAFAAAGWVVLTLLDPRTTPQGGLLTIVAATACLAAYWPRPGSSRAPAHRGVRRTEPGLLAAMFSRPSSVLVLSFLLLSLAGAVLLALPISGTASISWLDALFTAVSAVCVTGLIVLDTPAALTGFGQLVVLGLIQVGGLGIMVFSAAAILIAGRRLSVGHERVAAEIVGASSRAALLTAVRRILVVTLVVETATAAILYATFAAHGDPPAMALWRGVFTAISAFCNAGFALQSDSLVPYATNPVVLVTVGLAISLGGLGPAVVAAWALRERLNVVARLVLWTSFILMASTTIAIVAVEWDVSLAAFDPADRVVNAWFQAVTLRTAGFNSIDLTAIHPVTWTLMLAMMFVGGSPGSTAGGVKTTTIAVVALVLAAVIRGRERVEAFGRTLENATLLRATAVMTIATLGFVAALSALLLTQRIPLDVAIFEVVSALGTVGLSTGGTAMLDEVGKIIIITCMFAGRIGPLTLFVFLASHAGIEPPARYPDSSVPIG